VKAVAYDENTMSQIIQETRRSVQKIHGPKPVKQDDLVEGPGLEGYDEFGESDDAQVAAELGISRPVKEAAPEHRTRVRVKQPSSSGTSARAARLRKRKSGPVFEYKRPYFVITGCDGNSVRLKAPEEVDSMLEAIEKAGI
jgi:hypothetical protein